MEECRFVVLMGVAGAGKTTVGRLLAATMSWRFIDADDYHSSAAIDKMTQGTGLSEEDRKPWLARVAKAIEDVIQKEKVVIACSSLKKVHRQQLLAVGPGGLIVFLKGDRKLIGERLAARSTHSAHFFDPALLTDQFAVLEEPVGEESITMDVSLSPSKIVDYLLKQNGKKFVICSMAIGTSGPA